MPVPLLVTTKHHGVIRDRLIDIDEQSAPYRSRKFPSIPTWQPEVESIHPSLPRSPVCACLSLSLPTGSSRDGDLNLSCSQAHCCFRARNCLAKGTCSLNVHYAIFLGEVNLRHGNKRPKRYPFKLHHINF